MNITIPTVSTAIFLISIIIGIAVPAASFYFVKKAGGSNSRAFWYGCAVYIVFALLLENIVNTSVLTSPLGLVIQKSAAAYGIYAGLMGALFEDIGRFLAFKLIIKKLGTNDRNALLYTVGHGSTDGFYFRCLPKILFCILLLFL